MMTYEKPKAELISFECEVVMNDLLGLPTWSSEEGDEDI